MRTRHRTLLAAMLLGAAGCNREKPPLQEPPPPSVEVARPVRMTVTDYREYTGYIEATQIITIRARVRGVLKSVEFQEGTDVEKDALLFELDPLEYELAVEQAKGALEKAKADIQRSEAEWDKSVADLKRAEQLKSTNSISDEEFASITSANKVSLAAKAQAVASKDQAAAAMKTAETNLGYTKIFAPVSGRISRTLVNVGNLVGYNEATPLTTLITTNPVYVQFDVPEVDAIEYDRKARAENLPKPTDGKIPVEVGVTSESGFPHIGVIDFRENRIESGSGTVRMRGVLPNDQRTMSTGMYARVRVPKDGPKSRLMVPEAAVLSDQRGRYVLTVNEDNVVVYKPVAIGPRVGTQIAVEARGKGGKIDDVLKESDWVVVAGVQLARPNAKVAPQKKEAGPTSAASPPTKS